MRALVTGATGLIGRSLVGQLLARGVAVRALARPASLVRPLARLGVEIVAGDITDADSVRSATKDVDFVYHSAGLVRLGAPRALQIAINAEGARHVFEAARAESVRRVIHVSSIAVYREWGDRIPENAPLGPPEARAYRWAKYLGEQYAWRACGSGLPVTIIRPAFVYGRHARQLRLVFPLLRLPVLVVPPNLMVRRSFVHADDVARLCLAAADSDTSVGEAFNAVGPTDVSPGELLVTWRRLAGWGPRLVPLPSLRGRSPNRTFSGEKAQVRLGFTPSVDLVAGIAELVAEYRRRAGQRAHR